ncbi:hypothetical protein PIB30_073612 [Stylosanthes scabra]|uniref:Uncharacterized protein n=1 Tax=Stylosanthes scabra TaxID=79078 RepID=A0ABU6RQB9_9FABA|nr:hypothetical protein [Stylosanthes scabra]
MMNSVLYFSFAVVFTFLLSTGHVMTQEISKGNKEQSSEKNNNGNNFKYPTSFQDLNKEKRHYKSSRYVDYYQKEDNYGAIHPSSDSQQDGLVFRFGHPRIGQITVPFPFTNSMFVPPKATQRNSLYTTPPPAAIHGYYLGYQPLGLKHVGSASSDGPANYYHKKDPYATSDYQPDDFCFRRFGCVQFGKIPTPFPLSNSMFVPPKPQRNSLYATNSAGATHGYYGYQPLGLEHHIENFEDGRAIKHRKIMTRPSKIDGSLFHVIPAAKISSMMTNGGK